MKYSGTLFLLGVGLTSMVFGVEGKSLWSSSPGTYGSGNNYILKSGYPVGNGILAGTSHSTLLAG